MKPFDLNKALSNKPVQLRNGCKAIIYYNISEDLCYKDGSRTSFPIKGLILDENEYLNISSAEWTEEGYFNADRTKSQYDIIDMWNEITSIIRKALKERLPLKTRDGTKVFIAGIVESTDDLTKDFPVFGYTDDTDSLRWGIHGNYLKEMTDELDIVGFYE